MGIKRRVAAGLCAVALMAALVAFPVRAQAAAALPAIGYAVTISAFLAACGIYPFQDENGQSFGEWGAQKLTELWNTYITEVYPQSEAAQVISDVKSFYASGGYMVMAADTWSRLRDFAGWIVNRFSVQSGQTGLELGESSLSGFAAFPATVNAPLLTGAEIISNGIKVGYSLLNSADTYYSVYCDIGAEVYFCYYLEHYYRHEGPHLDGDYYFPLILSRSAFQKAYSSLNFSSPSYQADAPNFYDGVVYWSARGYPIKTSTLISGVPLYASRSAALAAFEGATPTLAGITADTGATIAIPDALPEGAEMGGLAVAGAGAGADVLEGVIESGVMERQKPVVRPVEVEVGEGAEVDTGTGAVTEELPSVITITPESVPLTVSDYSIPGLSGLFPFSIPWDIMRIWQALDAEPRFPLQDFSVTLDIPLLFGENPPSVTFDLQSMPQARQKVEDVARIVRWCLYLVACIGFLVFISVFIKF